MYAIVEIAGQQFKVENDTKLFVHRLAAAEGDSVSFDKILLIDNDGQVNIGTPTIEVATIEATVLKHVKGDKVIVFKKKRRKGYAVKNGHRQQFTQIQIEAINIAGKTKKKSSKKDETETAEAV
jgi:large subunit ribosomal protein L21